MLVHFSVGGEQFTSHLARQSEALTGGIYKGFISHGQIDLLICIEDGVR